MPAAALWLRWLKSAALAFCICCSLRRQQREARCYTSRLGVRTEENKLHPGFKIFSTVFQRAPTEIMA